MTTNLSHSGFVAEWRGMDAQGRDILVRTDKVQIDDEDLRDEAVHTALWCAAAMDDDIMSAVMGIDPTLRVEDPFAWADAISNRPQPTKVTWLTGAELGQRYELASDIEMESQACQPYGGTVWVDGQVL